MVRPQLRIELGPVGRCRVPDAILEGAREIGLRQSGCRAGDDGRIAIGTDAEAGLGSQAARTSAGAGGCRSYAGNGLQQARPKQWHQQQVDTVQAAESTAITAANDGLAIAEHFVKPSSPKLRIPGKRGVWADASVERFIRIFRATSNIIDGGKSDGRIVGLPLQRSRLTALKVSLDVDRSALRVHHENLLAIFFQRRLRQVVAESVRHR